MSVDSIPGPEAIAKAGLAAYGRRALLVLFVLNAVDEFDRAVLAVALDRIREDFGLSDAEVGLLPLAVIFITGLLSLPAGNLADRYDRTKILAYGSIIWGGAGLLAAGSRNFVQLFLTRALLGFGQGSINPTHASLLSDYYPVAIRGRVLGYHRAANPLGQVIGAVVGGAIIAGVGWRWGFVAAAIPGLLFGMWALSLREPKRGQADLEAAKEANPLLTDFMTEPQDAWGFRQSLGTIFGIPTLRRLIFANAAFGFTLIGIIFWFPTLYERRYGYTTEQAGITFGALALAAFFGTWFGGPFADRNVKRGFGYVGTVSALGGAILATTWTIGFLTTSPLVTLAFVATGGFLASLGVPGMSALVAACSPPRIRSQAFAAFGLALAVCGAAAAPLVVGLISDLLQDRYGVNEGDSVRYAMIIACAIVMSLGTWFIYSASRSASADAKKVIAAFIAERTGHGDEG